MPIAYIAVLQHAQIHRTPHLGDGGTPAVSTLPDHVCFSQSHTNRSLTGPLVLALHPPNTIMCECHSAAVWKTRGAGAFSDPALQNTPVAKKIRFGERNVVVWPAADTEGFPEWLGPDGTRLRAGMSGKVWWGCSTRGGVLLPPTGMEGGGGSQSPNLPPTEFRVFPCSPDWGLPQLLKPSGVS